MEGWTHTELDTSGRNFLTKCFEIADTLLRHLERLGHVVALHPVAT
jgi:hypothetical protein